jgi:hypothetical protein
MERNLYVLMGNSNCALLFSLTKYLIKTKQYTHHNTWGVYLPYHTAEIQNRNSLGESNLKHVRVVLVDVDTTMVALLTSSSSDIKDESALSSSVLLTLAGSGCVGTRYGYLDGLPCIRILLYLGLPQHSLGIILVLDP